MATIIASRDSVFVSNGLKLLIMNFKRTRNRGFASALRPQDEPFSYSEYLKSLKEPFKGKIEAHNMHEALQSIMTPFHGISYEDELQMKLMKNREAIHKLLRKGSPSSPEVSCLPERSYQYRNQDEFSIGMGVDGNPKTVGFFLKTSSSGGTKVLCVPPTKISIIKDKHKEICAWYEGFIRGNDYSVYHQERNPIGFWSSISIRTNSKEESFVRIKVNGRVSEDVIQDLGCTLSKQGGILKLTLEQVISKERVDVFGGDLEFRESIGDLNLRVSQDTNLFSNPSMIPQLSRNIERALKLRSHNSVLMELNCGCGVLGMLATSRTPNTRLIGFDKDVSDALLNAQENELTHRASYFHGDPKKTLPKFFEVASESMLGASPVHVLIRSRESLGHEVIESLRASSHVKRIVYLTSVPDKQPLFDFINLLKKQWNPIKKSTEPFLFHYALPIDCYPSTRHCEHVYVFTREYKP